MKTTPPKTGLGESGRRATRAIVVLTVLFAFGCNKDTNSLSEAEDPEVARVAPASQQDSASPRDLPPLPDEDGEVLYSFLLQQIPELVSQVPCSCCGKTLDWCYEGGCPPT